MAKSLPESASQSRAVLSSEAVSTRRPSGLKTALLIRSVWPWKMAKSLPLSASQSRAVLSWEAVSTRRSSGLKTALKTGSVWPWKVAKSLPLSASQSRAVCPRGGQHAAAVRAEDRARNPAAMALESGQELAAVGLPEPRGLVLRGGEHAAAVRAEDRAVTLPVWPWKMAKSLPLSASQSRAVSSSEAVSTRRPSGLKTALINPVGMALESGQELAAVSLPEPRGMVIRGGEHAAAVWAEHRAPNRAAMALESGQELAAVGLPEPRSLVLRGGEHAAAVWAEDRARNPRRCGLGKWPRACRCQPPRAARFGPPRR